MKLQSSSLPKFAAGIAVAVAATFIAVPKSQAVGITSLNFENIDPTNSNSVFVQNFYNGGTSSSGTSGTNYGVSFSPNAIALCLNTLSRTCSNTSHGGLGDPASADGALFFLTGAQTYLNYAGGFDTGFSFDYSAIGVGGSVSVYDGLNGTGNLLATLSLPATASGPCPGYNAGYCPFVDAGVAFSGTAQSISFAGAANGIVFDDITFGSITPGPGTTAVPEPFTIVGTLVGGTAALRMRKKLKSSDKA
jgi:hypothetical protein